MMISSFIYLSSPFVFVCLLLWIYPQSVAVLHECYTQANQPGQCWNVINLNHAHDLSKCLNHSQPQLYCIPFAKPDFTSDGKHEVENMRIARLLDKAVMYAMSLRNYTVEDVKELSAERVVETGQSSRKQASGQQKPSRAALRKYRLADILVLTAQYLVRSSLSVESVRAISIRKHPVLKYMCEDVATADIECNNRRARDFQNYAIHYRSIDGSCNNLEHPQWGASDTPLLRMHKSYYEDNISTPRVSSVLDGQRMLPSARDVSRIVSHDSRQLEHRSLTMMVMQWGQFLDHDISHTPNVETRGGAIPACCMFGYPLPANRKHAECMPIAVASDDSFYSLYAERCMEFARSAFAPDINCRLGAREQVNQITAYIDASNVYGSWRANDEDYEELRSRTDGRLTVQRILGHDHEFMPRNEFACRNYADPRQACFYAGDTRVNEQLNLVILHELFVAEHNRVADILAALNAGVWAREQVYQETRRIIAALMQHITYNEFLPLVIGKKYMRKLGLSVRRKGFTFNYNPTINAGISNEFSTAAFRFGHTLIPDNITLIDEQNSIDTNIALHRTQFAPFPMYRENGTANLVRGLLHKPCMRQDAIFSKEITNRLFQFEGYYGMDLVALNIQRGRDHAIPSYNEMRERCGLARALSFDDLLRDMDSDVVDRLKQVYEHVDDIDLYIGGVSEKSDSYNLIGPLFRCIIEDQFVRLRNGDSFFYEEGGRLTSFTEDQLNEIKKIRLSDILCNYKSISEVQSNSFLLPNSRTNKNILCGSIDHNKIDFSFWKKI